MKVEVQPKKTQQEWSEPGFPSRTDCGLATTNGDQLQRTGCNIGAV
jgi:hypothetical protein